MSILKIVKNPYISLLCNLSYAVSNCVIGFSMSSWWFITISAYYAVLTTTRFSILQIKRKAKGNLEAEHFAKKITGILLIVLSICIAGDTILSTLKERGSSFHKIIMIAIATYTFTKITIAIIGMVKSKQSLSAVTKALRNISLADACVSIYSMQRSMLVSFPGMEPAEIQLLNILTGTAVWITVLLLGINLTGGKYANIAKSSISMTSNRITKSFTHGYKKVEKGVITGYQKTQQAVVNVYAKIEDRFIEAYLTKDNETLQEAKKRLKRRKDT
jgi:hypothetical protein